MTSAACDPSPAGKVAGLESGEAADVLRYWRALIRHEEALSVRPRARRPAPSESKLLDLAAPVAGQDYMKLPFAGAERLLLEQQGQVRVPLDAERLGFFEHWLAAKYRQLDEESRSNHLALFPILHSPRQELLGLLRFPVELEWWAGTRRFEPPEPAARRGPNVPALPDELRIQSAASGSEQGPACFVDLKLLRDTLRVEEEALDGFAKLLQQTPAPSAQKLVEGLCRLLVASIEAEGGEPSQHEPQPDSPAAWLERLQRLLASRLQQLGSGHRAFPLALIVASERSRTTWHVQRDLEQALEQLGARGLRSETPLGAYLGGCAPAGRERVCLGRWPHAPLTASQRAALEHALGSPFAAVQGPPGTGKTTVILNLVAHQLIENVRSLVEGGVMGQDFVLVTSTNNRAVDNVVEPLSLGELADVPLCLRVGHRALVEKVSARTLERVRAWLTRQPEQADAAALAAAKESFRSALARVEARTSTAQAAHERAELLATLEQARAELLQLGSAAGRRAAETRAAECVTRLLKGAAAPEHALGDAARWRASPKAAAFVVAALVRTLDQLSEQCEQDAPAASKRVAAQFARLRERQLDALASVLGVPLELEAPGAGASLDEWADAIANALGPLVALEQALEQLAETEHVGERLRTLEARIAELPAPSSAEPAPRDQLEPADGEAAAAEFQALFQRALELRSAWLREHRAPILRSLEQAISDCKNLRSLRKLLDSPKAAGSWLRQLFPSLGCTLLSLGNALRADQASCRRVVIDEAGQCPSAYAVSALLRARSALLIGDTHQLEPVVGLSREDERRITRGLGLRLAGERLAPYQMFDECGNSAQSLADRAVRVRPTLRDHFRCQPDIIALPEAWCGYGMSVCTPPRARTAQAPRLVSAALFQDCAGAQERFAGSWVNPREIEQVLAWLGYLLQHGILAGEIGVITPFRSQAEALARRLVAARIPLARAFEDEEADAALELFGTRELRAGGVAVGTVHRFQGGERSIVLFSSTLTRTANLRFIDERVNLLNVAVSRAQEHLLVIGHAETLQAGRHTRLLVSEAVHVEGF